MKTLMNNLLVKKKVLQDYFKATSCAFSTTLNLSRALGVEPDPALLHSVIGFSAGISSMGDTCGVVSGGTIALGGRYAHTDRLLDAQFYVACSEYYKNIEARLITPNCGRVHGGKKLAKNFRRSILTLKPLKCMQILIHGTEVIRDIERQIAMGADELSKKAEYPVIASMVRYFKKEQFHCCISVIKEIARQSNLDSSTIQHCLLGFAGGVGFNGTLCGAIAGGVFCLGLKSGIELIDSSYWDAMKVIIAGIAINENIFSNEKYFPAAGLFTQCEKLYGTVVQKFGGAHCNEILNCKLNEESGCHAYCGANMIEICREIVDTVVDCVMDLWENPSEGKTENNGEYHDTHLGEYAAFEETTNESQR